MRCTLSLSLSTPHDDTQSKSKFYCEYLKSITRPDFNNLDSLWQRGIVQPAALLVLLPLAGPL